MNNPYDFSNFRFDRLRIPISVLFVLGVLIILILAWLLLNPNQYFFFSLVIAVILVWIASFGWRLALVRLINYLQRINRS